MITFPVHNRVTGDISYEPKKGVTGVHTLRGKLRQIRDALSVMEDAPEGVMAALDLAFDSWERPEISSNAVDSNLSIVSQKQERGRLYSEARHQQQHEREASYFAARGAIHEVGERAWVAFLNDQVHTAVSAFSLPNEKRFAAVRELHGNLLSLGVLGRVVGGRGDEYWLADLEAYYVWQLGQVDPAFAQDADKLLNDTRLHDFTDVIESALPRLTYRTLCLEGREWNPGCYSATEVLAHVNEITPPPEPEPRRLVRVSAIFV